MPSKRLNIGLNPNAIRARIEEIAGPRLTRQQEWADLIGVSQPLVSKVHGDNQHNPSVEYALQVARVTGVSIRWLLWGEGKAWTGGTPAATNRVTESTPPYGGEELEDLTLAIAELRKQPHDAAWVRGLLRILRAGSDDARRGIEANINAFLGDLRQAKVIPPTKHGEGRKARDAG